MADYYEYTATGNRAIRVGPGVNHGRIASNSDFLVNKIAKGNATGDSRYALTAADISVIDGIAYVGDVWVRVYDNDGKAVDGWTALTHKGIPQVTEKLIATTPPPVGTPASIDMILAAGSVVTIKDENGNVLWSGTA